jgi:hypothetical protein
MSVVLRLILLLSSLAPPLVRCIGSLFSKAVNQMASGTLE